MKAGHSTNYWPASADQTARTYGYQPVSECEEAIAAGTAGPSHSGERGLVDYGIVEAQNNDEIVSVNDKHVLAEMRELMLLEDAVFISPNLHLWKSDESIARGADDPVDGICGLEINPENTEIIPYSAIRSLREDEHSRHLIIEIDDGTQHAITLAPKPGLINLASRTKRRHQRAEELAKLINQHR